MSALEADEETRLAAVHALSIREGQHLPELDQLCAIASEHFGMPIAFVSLIEDSLQRMIAGDLSGAMPRDESVCHYTIQSPQVLVIEDLLSDPRFAENRTILREGLRFYAGAPIILDDTLALGSMCMMDRTPRSFSAEQRALLARYADVALGLLREHALAVIEEAQRGEILDKERTLLRQHRVLVQTERLAGLGGWEMRGDGGSVVWSEGLYRIADIPSGTPVTLETTLAFFAARDSDAFQAAMRALARDGTPFDLTLEGRTPTGIARWVRITGEREEGAEPAKLFGVVRDVTLEHEQQAQLWHMANHDNLTGLPNRGYFNHRFETALHEAYRSGQRVALLFIDLDRFKDINDTLGHKAGDALLIEVARRIERRLRPADTVGRLGGDEFAVVLSPVDGAETAGRIADRLLKTFEEPFTGISERLSPSASIGIAVFPEDGRSTQDLIRNADLALYAAKHAGRNAYRFYGAGTGSGNA